MSGGSCGNCEAELPQSSWHQLYCSPKCRELAGEKRWRARRKAARPPMQMPLLICCGKCGLEVRKPPRGRSPAAPFCSSCRKSLDRGEHSLRWRVANPERSRESAATSRRKWRTSGKVRAHQSQSGQIRNALRGCKDGRRWKTLVGYGRRELASHLERQFVSGMTWDNYGSWHIDHIVPASSYGLIGWNEQEIAACWVLSKSRPAVGGAKSEQEGPAGHLALRAGVTHGRHYRTARRRGCPSRA